jgi:polar amino acid transport system substrate-binding protein
VRRAPAILLVALLSILAAGCGGSSNKAANATATTTGTSCKKDTLNLVNAGQLTVGTDNPAFPPWFGGPEKKAPWKVSNPYSREGYESAVAYAVASKLGFSNAQVKWIVVPFNTSFAPGPKKFDFDINQISYSPARAKTVDFSDSYYNVNQALVVVKGTPIASATSIAALKPYKFGAQLGTTRYDYIVNNIKPA